MGGEVKRIMKEYKVSYYFNDQDSFDMPIMADNIESAVKLVEKALEKKIVTIKLDDKRVQGYNLANAIKFHIS